MNHSEEYNKLKENIIEASFYITKYVGDGEYDKANSYRTELNRLVDEVMKYKISK